MEQIIVNGLFLGASYALIALGLTLIFSLMNVLNFAHGQMYVIGGFITYTVVAQFHLPFVVGLICSAVALAALGAFVERFLFAPVIRRSKREESTMLLAAGIAFFLDAVTLLVFGEKQRGIPKLVPGVFNWDFRIVMPYDRILIGVLAVALIGAFILFMRQSRTGRAMRPWRKTGWRPSDGGRCRALFDDRLCAGRDAGGAGGRASRLDRRREPWHGRPDLDQGLSDDHDRRRRGDFGRHRRGLHSGHAGIRGPVLLAAYGDITYLVIFASLMIFLAFRPQGLMGKPWG
ncbi:branched-chain amino acid ABC transporter permease [Rhodobacter capsulatus]|uniref:branched-chain amino acid ABC transporter permease n=1 Tax=Rhodobacter capsulatus TaxID=1061 RepID=UPI004028E488